MAGIFNPDWRNLIWYNVVLKFRVTFELGWSGRGSKGNPHMELEYEFYYLVPPCTGIVTNNLMSLCERKGVDGKHRVAKLSDRGGIERSIIAILTKSLKFLIKRSEFPIRSLYCTKPALKSLSMLVWPVISLLCQLAWVGRLSILYGSHELRGFHVWDSDTESNALKDLPAACRASLTQLVKCDPYTLMFLEGRYRGSLEDDDLAQSVCDKSCATSLESWFKTVDLTCAGYSVSGSAATKYGGQIWSGWNETCLKDPTSGKYCNGKHLISSSLSHILTLTIYSHV